MAQQTPETSGPKRPFKYHGNQGELTLIAPLKPGGAEKARELLDYITEETPGRIPTLHNFRVAFFDNETRMLFASVYDGDWDQYINDFAAGAQMGLNLIGDLWSNLEGFPGLDSPEVKDYLVKYQVEPEYFWSAYPNTTVKRIKRAERVLAGFDQMLDAAG